MTTEPIPSLAEAMAEIRRLRARIEAMEAEIRDLEGSLLAAEYRRQAERATMLGTLAKSSEDEPSLHVKHNLPPSAPPHDE